MIVIWQDHINTEIMLVDIQIMVMIKSQQVLETEKDQDIQFDKEMQCPKNVLVLAY